MNFLGPFLGILWEIFGKSLGNLWDVPRNCLESYFNIEGIDLCIKTMVFVKILSQFTRKTKLDPWKCKRQAHRT